MSDVAGSIVLPRHWAATRMRLFAMADEFTGKCALEHATVDLRGPVSIERVDGLETGEPCGAPSSLQRTLLALCTLVARKLLERDAAAPAAFRLGSEGCAVCENHAHRGAGPARNSAQRSFERQ